MGAATDVARSGEAPPTLDAGPRWVDLRWADDAGAPTLTPPSDGRGGAAPCSDTNPWACAPCRNGGTCGWVQDVFLR